MRYGKNNVQKISASYVRSNVYGIVLDQYTNIKLGCLFIDRCGYIFDMFWMFPEFFLLITAGRRFQYANKWNRYYLHESWSWNLDQKYKFWSCITVNVLLQYLFWNSLFGRVATISNVDYNYNSWLLEPVLVTKLIKR